MAAMHPTHPSSRRRAGGVVAAALAAWACCISLAPGTRPGTDAGPALTASGAAQLLRQAGSLLAWTAQPEESPCCGQPPAPNTARDLAVPAGSVAEDTDPAGELSCASVPDAEVSAGPGAVADRVPGAVVAASWQLLADTMARHPDVRVRAAALALAVQRGLPEDALAEAREQDAACRLARRDHLDETVSFCATDARRRQDELLAPVRSAVDELARLAVLSGDGVVHALAQEACAPEGLTHHEPPPHCHLADAAAWARATPDWAEPWLLLAAEAEDRGDAGAAEQALARAARATQLDAGAGALGALVLQALPASFTPAERAQTWDEIGHWAPVSTPAALAAAQQLCGTLPRPAGSATPRPVARYPACAALAQRMAVQGRSVETAGAGVQLGEQLGWPAATTSAWARDQAEALASRRRILDDGGSGSCDARRRQHRLTLLTARLGALEAGRQVLQR